MWRYVGSQPDFHKDGQTMALASRVGFILRVFIAIMVCGVLVSFVHVRAGIACFALMPFAAFYGYVRDPLRSKQGS